MPVDFDKLKSYISNASTKEKTKRWKQRNSTDSKLITEKSGVIKMLKKKTIKREKENNDTWNKEKQNENKKQTARQ